MFPQTYVKNDYQPIYEQMYFERNAFKYLLFRFNFLRNKLIIPTVLTHSLF